LPSISKNEWWRSVTPTFSTSLIRRHFCAVVTRCQVPSWPANLGVAPRKYGLNCTIPALVNMRVGSSLLTDAEP